MAPTLHRLEEYNNSQNSNPMVICSFETSRFGYLQVQLSQLNEAWKFESLRNEPDLQMFKTSDIHEMECISRIVWRMVYDTPAKTDRFK
jgi:hypothetical protein